jgi:hypothetical protein
VTRKCPSCRQGLLGAQQNPHPACAGAKTSRRGNVLIAFVGISQPPLSFGALIISPLSARQSAWPDLCQPVSDDPVISHLAEFWLAAKTADPITQIATAIAT